MTVLGDHLPQGKIGSKAVMGSAQPVVGEVDPVFVIPRHLKVGDLLVCAGAANADSAVAHVLGDAPVLLAVRSVIVRIRLPTEHAVALQPGKWLLNGHSGSLEGLPRCRSPTPARKR